MGLTPTMVPAAEPKRVLVVHSFGRDFSPWAEFTRSFREELDGKLPVPPEFYDASIATERFGAGQDEGPFVDYLRTLFIKRQLDMIMAVGAPAARFIQQNRHQLFPSTPMLFAGIEQRRIPPRTLGVNDTVVAISINFLTVIEDILRLLPETTNIAVIVGNSPNEQYWMEQIRDAAQPYTRRVRFVGLGDLSLDEMLKQVSKLPPKAAILYFALLVDGAGVSHEGGKPFAKVHAAANAPIFSYIDTDFGNGLIGGSLVLGNEASQQAASVAIRILNGEAPNEIKVPPTGHGKPKYDWRELQRWNISEARLPPGSEIHFREPSAWERYRWQLTGVFLALLVQSAMISWLLIERFGRRRAEFESRQRSLEVMHLNRTAEVAALSASFAHEISQPLVSVALNAESAENLLKTDRPEIGKLKEIVADILHANSLAVDVVMNIRSLLKRKSDIQECDLNASIADALQLLSPEAANKRKIILRATGVQHPLMVRADPVHLEQLILNLVTNGMDAMANTALDARQITIQTALAEGSNVEVSVSDSGTGIPEDKLAEIFETFYTTKEQGTGLGLSVARTIIDTYNGKIWAENRPGGGAVFRFTLPLLNATPGGR